jgi:hypothetical protein
MLYEVEVIARVYVSVEFGGEDAARRIVRDRVANDWLIQEREATAVDSGKYVVKGMSAAVGTVKPWIGNMRVKAKEGEDV